jgi:hypothetical protein
VACAASFGGRREIVGIHIGPSEAETFWSTFLKSLARRGLRGIKLVISDAHEGLKAAIRRELHFRWEQNRGAQPPITRIIGARSHHAVRDLLLPERTKGTILPLTTTGNPGNVG